MTSHPFDYFLRDGFQASYGYNQILNRLGSVNQFADYQKKSWLLSFESEYFSCRVCGDRHEWVTIDGIHFKYCPTDPTAPPFKASQQERKSYRLNWLVLSRFLCQTHNLEPLLSQQNQMLLVGYNTEHVVGLSTATNEHQLCQHLELLREKYGRHKPIICTSSLLPIADTAISLVRAVKGELLTIDKALNTNALSKRISNPKGSRAKLPTIKPVLKLNAASQTLQYLDKRAELTPSEYLVCKQLWDTAETSSYQHVENDDLNVAKIIYEIRDKLFNISNKTLNGKKVIITRRGTGYTLNINDYEFETLN
jgi:hypothetical protein